MRYKDLSFPIVPYLELEIAGQTFNCMDFLTEAEIEVIGDWANGISKANIAIYDYTALEIEKLLLKNREIKLKYGLVDSKGKVYAESYKGFANTFTPVIKPEGTGITINAVLTPFIKLNQKDKQRSFNDEISNIVSQIAQENGLKADVDKTDIKGVFRQLNQTDYDFIRKVLLPKANSTQNDSPFFFWIEGDTLYFKQLKTDKPKHKFVLPHDVNEDITAPVLSFSPEFNVMSGIFAGDKVKVKKLDPLKKEFSEEVIDNSSMSKRVVLGEKKTLTGSEKIRVAAHGNTKNEEVARYKNMWSKLSDFPVKATLEILGNPFIKQNEIAEVLVYITNQKTKEVNLYHHSGNYFIKSVKHNISAGSFKTSLEMIKNAGIEGQEQAKGIINKQTA